MSYRPSLLLDFARIAGVKTTTDKNGTMVGHVALEIVGMPAAAMAELVRLQRAGALSVRLDGLSPYLDEDYAPKAAPEAAKGKDDGMAVTLSSGGRSVELTERELEELARGAGERTDAVDLVAGVLRRVQRGPAPPGVDPETGEIGE